MKKPNKQVQQKLEKLALEGLDSAKENLILKDNGLYYVFGLYEIRPNKEGCSLQSELHDPRNFSSVQSALAWCIAHKYNRHDVAREIQDLDHHKQLTENDIKVRYGLAIKMRDVVRKDAAMLKIDQRRQQLYQVNDRLTKCINLAKYWQIRGFNNETARTGRPASHTKNR